MSLNKEKKIKTKKRLKQFINIECFKFIAKLKKKTKFIMLNNKILVQFTTLEKEGFNKRM